MSCDVSKGAVTAPLQLAHPIRPPLARSDLVDRPRPGSPVSDSFGPAFSLVPAAACPHHHVSRIVS